MEAVQVARLVVGIPYHPHFYSCDSYLWYVRPTFDLEIFPKKSGDLTLSLSRQLGRSASYPSSSSDSQERGPTTGACRGLATRQASSGSGIGTIGTTKPQNEGSDLADHHSQCKWIGEVFFIGLVFFTKGLPIWRHILGLLGWSIPILEIKLCNRSPRRCENKEILGIIERVWSLKIRQWLEANRHPINLFWNQKNSAKPTSFDQEKSCLTSGSAQLTWDLCVKKGGSNSKYRRLKRIGDPNLGLKTLPETSIQST